MLLLLYKITIAFFEDKVYYIMAKNDKKGSYDKMIKVIVIIAIILYTVQIYAEFSECMDIVRGIAHVIGIEMEYGMKLVGNIFFMNYIIT